MAYLARQLIGREKTEDLLPRPSDCLKRNAILQFYTRISPECDVARVGCVPQWGDALTHLDPLAGGFAIYLARRGPVMQSLLMHCNRIFCQISKGVHINHLGCRQL